MQARPSLHMSKCHIVGNYMSQLIVYLTLSLLVSHIFNNLSVPLEVNIPVSGGYQRTHSTLNLCLCLFDNPIWATLSHTCLGLPLVLTRSCMAMYPSAPPERRLK